MEHCNVQGKSILQGINKNFPKTITLTQYFTNGFAQGRIRPDNLALVDGEKQHTFRQLDDISGKISDAILECIQGTRNGNPDGDPVIGVCLQPSDRLISILLGILKAGCAYVPFDITFPEERIIKIVKGCRPLMIICDDKSNVLAKFESAKQHSLVVSLDELYRKIKPARRIPRICAIKKTGNETEETAIVLYTSGSSGEPKGVRLSHRAIMNRLSWQWDQFPFIPTEKCVFKTSLTFVDSVAEIFAPLLQGFQLIVFDKTVTSQPPLFMEKLHAYGITRVVVVPSLLKAIFQTLSLIGKNQGSKLLSSVRLWVCSGEALSYDLLTEFFDIFPDKFTLCNFYGSTEVMADVTFISYSSVLDVDWKTVDKRVPIGYAIQNSSIYILNEYLQAVPEGSMGEIFVSGSNLATGYVGIPNSDKFLQNPHSNLKEFSQIYRTGDFGRTVKLSNGDMVLMYEGRIDSQIKVRGQRVDLSEIEAVISGYDLVSKVKVLCYHPGEADQTIVAYIVPKSEAATQESLQLKMEQTLREYELPVVRIIDEIPLLVNGKTDRQRLLKIFESEMENREEFDNWQSLCIPAERLDIAKALLHIISQVTGTSLQLLAENFDDSFFNVGGTSLNTVVVIVKLRELNYYISIPDFTSASSIRDILMHTSTAEDSEEAVGNRNKDYVVTSLTDKDAEEAIHIISHSFSKRGDLEAYVNVTYDEFANLIKSIWKDIVEKQLSFIVRRKNNGKAVAVSLSFDVYDEPNEANCSGGIQYVMEFLEHVESRERNKLPSGKGKLLHSFMMGTPEDVDDSERVTLIEFMEEQNILIGKQHRFVGILTTNTNPLTMQIGRDLHGYEILCEYQVNQYVAPDGFKPFELAPNSFKIVCCWKRL